MSLPLIISLWYSLKIPEDEIFLFILLGKDSSLDAIDEIWAIFFLICPAKRM